MDALAYFPCAPYLPLVFNFQPHTVQKLLLMRFHSVTLTLAAIAVPALAAAHVGHQHGNVFSSFSEGFIHPITGIDHLLAIVAVGVWASHTGGNARWTLPATFVAAMALGGLLGGLGLINLPGAEFLIAASIVTIGMLLVLAPKVPMALAYTLTGLFALGHGFAHGLELPTNASIASFGGGMLIATALLHALGLGIGSLAKAVTAPDSTGRTFAFRTVGGAITAVGMLVLAGLI